MDWVLACKSKGCRFESHSGHMPGLRARNPVGVAWQATTHWCFSPFLCPFLPLTLKINKIFFKNDIHIPCSNETGMSGVNNDLSFVKPQSNHFTWIFSTINNTNQSILKTFFPWLLLCNTSLSLSSISLLYHSFNNDIVGIWSV